MLSIYIRKLEILVGKAKVLRYFIWEGSGNMGCDLRRPGFSTLFSVFSRFGFFFLYIVGFSPILSNFIVICLRLSAPLVLVPFFVQSVKINSPYKTDTSLTLSKLSEET